MFKLISRTGMFTWYYSLNVMFKKKTVSETDTTDNQQTPVQNLKS